MSFFAPPKPPASKLGHYRLLSTTAGVHVSPIALGAASIGDQWNDPNRAIPKTTKESSFKLLDTYFDLGGNFIDTAINYQEGSSESFIGEWAEQRGIRDQLFIATKYTINTWLRDPSVEQKILFQGNNAKNLHVSAETSLKRLRTTYIDLLYIHAWDYDTSVAEVMRALDTLVRARKVLYLGISDTPAWVVSKANQYARDHGLTSFSVYQGKWSILDRSFERDIIPMARDEGMALAPWEVLAAGKIRTDAEEEQRRATGEKGRTWFNPVWERNEDERKVAKALEEVATQVGAKSIASVAIAYVMHKARFVFPIIGGAKVEYLKNNIEALDISLTKEQIQYLEGVVPFNPGFPHDMIGNGASYTLLHSMSGHLDRWPEPEVITPSKNQETSAN